MTRRACKSFASDPTAPKYCAHCGRGVGTHEAAERCPRCDAACPPASGICVRCGEIVKVSA